jgi:hypothetical protein
MADKFLNVSVGGVNTPLKISNVSTIAVNGAGTATTITYSDGGTAIISIAAAGAASFPPSTAPQQAAWLRALWQQVIAGVATPWNLPIIPSPDAAWDFTVAPAAPQASQYVTQGATPAVNSMIAKVGTALIGTGNAATGNVGPVTGIA